MTKSYSPLLMWFGLTIAASLMLYHTSDRVNALERQLHAYNDQIEDEQRSLHVLKAEWVYLANPERIEAATKRHLDLKPTDTKRVVAINNIGVLLPVRDGVEPKVMVAEETVPAVTRIAAPSPIPARHKGVRTLAANNSGHVNDRMMMEHGAVMEASTDNIGHLMGTLGLNP